MTTVSPNIRARWTLIVCFVYVQFCFMLFFAVVALVFALVLVLVLVLVSCNICNHITITAPGNNQLCETITDSAALHITLP